MSDRQHAAYLRALNVVDVRFAEMLKVDGGNVDVYPGAKTHDVREALNHLLLCAPSDTCNAFMRVTGFLGGPVSGAMVAELRALMRRDLKLEPVVYADPERVWLAKIG